MAELFFWSWFQNRLEQRVVSCLRENLLAHMDRQIELWQEIREFTAGSHSLPEIKTAIWLMTTAEESKMDLAA